MPIPTDLGRRMASRRHDLGWTQEELAAASGVPRSWISLVETGGRAGPRADELERVARALGVTMAYLLHGERPAQTVPIDTPAAAAPYLVELARLPPVWVRFALDAALAAMDAAAQQEPVRDGVEQRNGRTAAVGQPF
jgi:transcriptional regulator with XRE-family HTH domain